MKHARPSEGEWIFLHLIPELWVVVSSNLDSRNRVWAQRVCRALYAHTPGRLLPAWIATDLPYWTWADERWDWLCRAVREISTVPILTSVRWTLTAGGLECMWDYRDFCVSITIATSFTLNGRWTLLCKFTEFAITMRKAECAKLRDIVDSFRVKVDKDWFIMSCVSSITEYYS